MTISTLAKGNKKFSYQLVEFFNLLTYSLDFFHSFSLSLSFFTFPLWTNEISATKCLIAREGFEITAREGGWQRESQEIPRSRRTTRSYQRWRSAPWIALTRFLPTYLPSFDLSRTTRTEWRNICKARREKLVLTVCN